MENLQDLQEILTPLIPFIIVLIVWDGIWKLLAMWKAGRNNHLSWFICIAVINSMGILPIIYILMYSKKSETANQIV